MLIWTSLGTLQFNTLQFNEVFALAPQAWAGTSVATTVTLLLLLVGAAAKSRAAPLHVWLPDAMAGPTPGEP